MFRHIGGSPVSGAWKKCQASLTKRSLTGRLRTDEHMTLTELATGSWTIDASRTVITATAKMMSAASVPATFTVVSGTISVTDGQLSSVEVVADAKSYTSSIGKRNKDVTSQKGLLDANNYPTITFTAAGGDEQRVSGEVEIKGKTVPLVFTVSKLDVQDDSASFELAATLDRFSVGVDKSPAFVIGRDIDVQVAVVANKAS